VFATLILNGDYSSATPCRSVGESGSSGREHQLRHGTATSRPHTGPRRNTRQGHGQSLVLSSRGNDVRIYRVDRGGQLIEKGWRSLPAWKGHLDLQTHAWRKRSSFNTGFAESSYHRFETPMGVW
jgi:hypothetical protein